MPEYKVKQGDCISSIAEKYGLFGEKVWDHPNNSRLKEKRKDPNILYPGDKVFVPEKEKKEKSGNTEQRHRFKSKGKRRYLRLVIQDPQENPLVRKPYILEIDGRLLEDPGATESKTDNNGVIEHQIPAGANKGRLSIDNEIWTLKLSSLDPLETIEGIQGRLNNMNYQVGPIDGIEGPRTREAIRNFQRDYDLVVDGKCGHKTQEKLKKVYGC